MNWVLLVVVVILLLSLWDGYRKGFLRTILSMVQLILSLVLVTLISPIVTNTIATKTNITEQIEIRLEAELAEHIQTEEWSQEMQKDFVEQMAAPEMLKSYLIQKIEEKGGDLAGSEIFTQNLSEVFAEFIVKLIGFVIAFIISNIVFQAISMVLGVVGHIPIIGSADRLGGAALGGLRAVIFLWILCLVIMAFQETPWGREIYAMIASNELLLKLYNSNYLLQFLVKTGI